MNARKHWLKKKGPQQVPPGGLGRRQEPRPSSSKRKPRARKNKRKLRVQKRNYTNRLCNAWEKRFWNSWARRHTRHPIPTPQTHAAFHRRRSIRRLFPPAIGKSPEVRSLAILENWHRGR